MLIMFERLHVIWFYLEPLLYNHFYFIFTHFFQGLGQVMTLCCFLFHRYSLAMPTTRTNNLRNIVCLIPPWEHIALLSKVLILSYLHSLPGYLSQYGPLVYMGSFNLHNIGIIQSRFILNLDIFGNV